MKTLIGASLLLLSACASAPQPHCMPPSVNREPPQAGSGVEEEYVRCKEREAEDRQEAQLREEEARAKQREAEKLKREREQGQDKQEPQAPTPNQGTVR